VSRQPWTWETQRQADQRVLDEAVRLAQQLVDRGHDIETAARRTSTADGRWRMRQLLAKEPTYSTRNTCAGD
jgi:hypothetical protein